MFSKLRTNFEEILNCVIYGNSSDPFSSTQWAFIEHLAAETNNEIDLLIVTIAITTSIKATHVFVLSGCDL
jgi:hypothetical protein